MLAKKLIAILLVSVISFILVLLLLLGPARVVVSDSMAPTYRAGDVLWIRPISEPITAGEIISYEQQGILITHRVAAVVGNTLVTKGDNNQSVDPWQVNVSDVVGTPVIRIPYAGYLISFIKQPLGWVLFVILPAGWIVGDEVKKIVFALKKPDTAG